MENGLLLTSLPPSQRPIISCCCCCCCCCCSIFFVPHLHFLQLKTTCHFHHHLRLSFTLSPKSSKWDSNAGRNFNFSFSEENQEEEEEEEEEEEQSSAGNVKKKKRKKRKWWSKNPPPKLNKKRAAIIFDEAVESILIFKVFKSFGWFLPVIVISYMLASGLKAFLMTFGFYLVLSVLLLAFEKLWGMTLWKPIGKSRVRRKASSMYASRVQMEDREVEEAQDATKEKMDTPSWVGSNNGPVNKGTQDVPDFGGWDFLDEARPMQGTSQVTSESQTTEEEILSSNGRRVPRKSQTTKEEKLSGNGRRGMSKSQRTEDEKLGGNGRRSDIPLLIRLLIAVFPFIGFWAKMFW